jgi:uncharacterized membrane protein YqiK
MIRGGVKMPNLSLGPVIYISVGVAFALFFIVLLAYKAFYKKVSADTALVVSGGKKKNAYFSGKLINPITCRTQLISLNTMNLRVERKSQEALITKDSLRVDIVAEFFVRIEPNESDVLAAAASLGERVMTPENVSELLEGKLVGALRSVAATMTLQELHEQRQQFADAVQEASSADLKQNGFTLETVSITSLDQTPLEQLDSDNRFDATAIQTIKGEVEEKQTLTAKITAQNKVKREEDQLKAQLDIKSRETETQKLTYKLEQDQAFAEEEKKREIETNRLEQERAVREAEYKQKKTIETARIAQEQAVQEAEFQQKQAVEKARIVQEQSVEEAEIQRKLAIETARISQEQKVKQAKIEQEKTIKEYEAESAISVARKQKEREIAEIDKLSASAEKAKAEEMVQTAMAVEEAERSKKIKVIEAEQTAEAEYISKQKIADAEVYKITKTSEAELEAAKLKAEAIRITAEAELEKAKAEAQGELAMIEAKNTAEQKVFNHEALISFIEQLPEITEKLMKPAEKIESIRVLDLGGRGAEGGNVGKIANAILNAGAAMPVFKEFMDMSGVDVNKLVQKAVEYVPSLSQKTNIPEKKETEPEQKPTEMKKDLDKTSST